MGRKKKVIPDDPEQYARFVETAERILTNNAEERIEETMKQILSKKKETKLDSQQ